MKTRYTIKISKSGINQYVGVEFNEENSLITKSLFIRYQKEPLSLESCHSLDDVLSLLKEYSYNKKAEIWKINGFEPNFFQNKDTYKKEIDIYHNAMQNMFKDFYTKNVVPLLPPKTYKKRVNEHKDFQKINFLCYSFLYSLGLEKYNSFDSESNYYGNYFDTLKTKAGL